MDKFALCFSFDVKDYTTIENVYSDMTFYNIVGFLDEPIKTILDNIKDYNSLERFENADDRVIMFVNFDHKQIQKFLKMYPNDVVRPMFCVLTEHNVNWSFGQLKDDLVKEREYFKNRK